MKRVELTLRGIVQGVGFRYFCHKQAENIGITGVVENMPDGSLRIEAQGEETSLGEFIALMKTGPRNSFVLEADQKDLPVEAEEKELEVK